MTTKIVDAEYLGRIAKFLSLTMADGMAKEKVLKYHKLNVMNYNQTYSKKDNTLQYDLNDLDLKEIPLISSVQAVSDLEVLYNNCSEYGLEINAQVFNEILQQIDHFKEFFDYSRMKQYHNHVKL